MNDHVAPLTSWVFTAVTALVLILMLTLSFLRYRRRKQRLREKEKEYVAQFGSILPGYNVRELKKTLARKIMTNTHAMAITEAVIAPIARPETDFDLFERKQASNTTQAPRAKDRLAAEISVHHEQDIRSPSDIRKLIPSQNSYDTTTDEEKPLVEYRGDGQIRPKTAKDRYNRLKGYSPRLGKTAEHVLYEKRRHKQKPENRDKSHAKELSMKSNFTSTPVEFDDERQQNYIVYTTNAVDKRGKSDPDVYTFPPHTEEAFPSVPTMAMNTYYLEAGADPIKHHKSKHSKSHKVERHGRKKQRRLDEHRARSLPSLDDVYYGNVIDELRQQDDERTRHDVESARQSAAEKDRVFIKRKPLTSQRATAQPDNIQPLIKMRSFPVISQSDETAESGFKESTFVSEYM